MSVKQKINRRDFFRVAAAGGAGVALAGCVNDGVETLLPRMLPPDDMITGTPYYFNTVCKECSANCGITVKTREGRALSISGNDTHPINRGAVCAVGQSAVQGLYNPARIKAPQLNQTNIKWDVALDTLADKITAAKFGEKKIVFLTRPETGSLSVLMDEFLEQVGGERVEFDLNTDNAIRLASEKLFGRFEKPQFHFDRADALINFGSDFLESWNSPAENAKKFSAMYSYKNGKKSRFYHVSPHLNLTGSNADSWLSCNPDTEVFVAYLLINSILDASGIDESKKQQIRLLTGKYTLPNVSKLTRISQTKLKNLVATASGRIKPLAVSGGNQTAGSSAFALHYAVLLYNYLAGNINTLVTYGSESVAHHPTAGKLKATMDDAKNKKIGVLIFNGINPAHALPVFSNALGNVDFTVSVDVSKTETTDISDLVLPLNHFLESWGDSNARNGVYSLQQPVMANLPGYAGKPFGDILLQLAIRLNVSENGLSAPHFKDYLKNRWTVIAEKYDQTSLFDVFWRTSLQNGGFFIETESTSVTLQDEFSDLDNRLKQVRLKSDRLKLTVVNSVFHNINGQTGDKLWLLEIPHPMTQIVWDSWIEINADRAIEMGINHGDEVEVSSPYGKGIFGAYVYHGVNYNTVTIPGGLGRKVLFPNYSQRRNSFLPFTSDNPKQLKYFKVGENAANLIGMVTDSTGGDLVLNGIDIQLKKTGNPADFVSLDGQYRNDKEGLVGDSKARYGDRSQKGRKIVQDTTVEEIRSGNLDNGHHLLKRNYTVEGTHNNSDFYEPMPEAVKESIFFKSPNDDPQYYDPYKFELTVDLDKCTGCSSCVVACYAENNIAIVGKERQRLGREMSWLRIERFFDKDEHGEPVTNIIPTMCQHCGNAGCEPVCPVYATYHNPDGLNVQVYNRCVGTRYCSNNCIYKQRRFNWRTYEFPEPLHMQLNPDISVRTKGVMEKCTFCIQRISHAKDNAKDDGRMVKDGEIVTACQGACSAGAISFGNAVDPTSAVSKQKIDDRSYVMFEETNFKPSVSYLKKIRRQKTV